MRNPELTTLCYIEKDNRYLMLHRIKKEKDINKDKYIGVGGHFEYGESPDECLMREVLEETGLKLISYRARGIVTFIYGDEVVEYMHLYTADGFEGTISDCDEGELVWVEKDKVCELKIWDGDKIFFGLLAEDRPFFSLKLVYSLNDELIEVRLDGKDVTV
jgi:8-oxo-dGTP diphosphatase